MLLLKLRLLQGGTQGGPFANTTCLPKAKIEEQVSILVRLALGAVPPCIQTVGGPIPLGLLVRCLGFKGKWVVARHCRGEASMVVRPRGSTVILASPNSLTVRHNACKSALAGAETPYK